MIRKAVFPVAGLGTRFLPATKASPKELLPIVDKPLIQYAVEEAVQAGITELIFVTSYHKRAIEDHFDTNFELEARLAENHKYKILEKVKAILPMGVNCVYIRQSQPLGLGHAVHCAKNVIGDEPFAVVLADDLIQGQGLSCLSQMVAQFEETQASIVAVEKIKKQQTKRYGVVAVDPDFSHFGLCHHIIEKPEPEKAPSHFGVVGRYILTPVIFDLLEQMQAGQGNEIQLTDAIAALIKKDKDKVFAFAFEGTRFDCGDKLGFLKAIMHYGVSHPEVGESFLRYLKNFENSKAY